MTLNEWVLDQRHCNCSKEYIKLQETRRTQSSSMESLTTQQNRTVLLPFLSPVACSTARYGVNPPFVDLELNSILNFSSTITP